MSREKILRKLAEIIQLKPGLITKLLKEYGYQISEKTELAKQTVTLISQGNKDFINDLSLLIFNENSNFHNAIAEIIGMAVGAIGNAVGSIVSSKNQAVASTYQYGTSVNQTTQELLGYMQEVEQTKQAQENKTIKIIAVSTLAVGGVASVVLLKKL